MRRLSLIAVAGALVLAAPAWAGSSGSSGITGPTGNPIPGSEGGASGPSGDGGPVESTGTTDVGTTDDHCFFVGTSDRYVCILAASAGGSCPDVSVGGSGSDGPSGASGVTGFRSQAGCAAAPPPHPRSGALPFTGFGLMVIAALAAGLIASGLEMRRHASPNA